MEGAAHHEVEYSPACCVAGSGSTENITLYARVGTWRDPITMRGRTALLKLANNFYGLAETEYVRLADG